MAEPDGEGVGEALDSETSGRLVAACLVATLAFWAYTQTLVPGVDMGDTGGFQAAVLWPEASARQAYPLYYQLARPFVRATGVTDPARGLNLFSALWGSVAAGLLTWLGAAIMRSTASGVVAGLLLAFSYTFWSQAILAEVYTLHLALMGLCLIALDAYARRPGTLRLGLVCACYSLSFGNHLSMILLFVPCVLFIVLVTPRPRWLLRPSIVGLALAIAAVGALQYVPNLTATWQSPDARGGWMDRLAAFWFDVTKADWRESMVLGVGADQIPDRLGMWWFDAQQQFGAVGLLLAVAGAFRLWHTSRAWGAMLMACFTICTAFALTYNVGDAHVFFLPSHFIVALFAGAAVASVKPGRPDPSAGSGSPRATSRGDKARPTRWRMLAISLLAIAYCGWRAWDTWPVVDRHDDRRAQALVTQLSLGLTERREVLVTALNWQLENVLLYESRYRRPDLLWARLPDVLPHFPFFADDNHSIGRDLVLDARAAGEVVAAFGSRFPLVEDGAVHAPSLWETISRVPMGAPYVLALLSPPRDEPLDPEAYAATVSMLTGGHPPSAAVGPYQVIAGLAGEPPSYTRSANRPFRERFTLLDDPMTVRMESWLPSDTFRRAGFGHLLVGRRRVMFLERGVNLVWFGPGGEPAPPAYGASLYSPQPRFRISGSAPHLAWTGRPQGRPLRIP